MKAINIILKRQEGTPVEEFVEIENDLGASVLIGIDSFDSQGHRVIRITASDIDVDLVLHLKESKACVERLRKERDEIQETLTAVEFEVAKVYYHITDGRISKCNTKAESVIDMSDDLEAERTQKTIERIEKGKS